MLIPTIEQDKICVHHFEHKNDGTAINKTNAAGITIWHFYNSIDVHINDDCITTEPDCVCITTDETLMRFFCRDTVKYDCLTLTNAAHKILEEYGLKTETVYYPHPATYISELISSIEVEIASSKAYFEQLIDLKVRELLIKTKRACTPKEISVGRETIERFHLVRFKMLSSLGENWTVARMADEASISPSYFHSVYKEIYGVSPTQDLINARISNAKNMLQNSKDSISTISKSLGYNNPYHFTRQFRQITGESPSKFRTNNSLL